MASNLDLRVAVPEHVAFEVLGGEAVLLDLERGLYFGLGPVGTRAWELLVEHGRLREVRDRMLSEYDVAPGVLEGDLAELVAELEASGLISTGSDA